MAGISFKRNSRFTATTLGTILVLSSLLLLFNPTHTFADVIQNRSIITSTNLPDQIAQHNFQFTVPTSSTLGSITFEYCSNSALFDQTCMPPAGLDVSAATLVSQSGNAGFTLDSGATTANMIEITRTPAVDSVDISNYDFGNIHNPSTPGETEYVRIALYPTDDASGTYNNNGAVAFAVASTFTVGATVPPFLRLCVGVSVAVDCSSETGDFIDMGNLSNSTANTAQTQFSTGTNSVNGYSVYAQGNTMTSGNNYIPPLSNPSPSVASTGQFGINLRANTSPVSGQDPDGPGAASPAPNYDSPNLFTYNNGDLVASANTSTDYNRMTVTYLVNVGASQPVGVYGSTLTYLAVAQF